LRKSPRPEKQEFGKKCRHLAGPRGEGRAKHFTGYPVGGGGVRNLTDAMFRGGDLHPCKGVDDSRGEVLTVFDCREKCPNIRPPWKRSAAWVPGGQTGLLTGRAAEVVLTGVGDEGGKKRKPCAMGKKKRNGRNTKDKAGRRQKGN